MHAKGNFIAKGATCKVYEYSPNHNYVLKVCGVTSKMKKALKQTGVKDLQQLVNGHFSVHMIGITQVLRQSSNSITYVQEKVAPLEKDQVTPAVVLSLLNVVKALLEKKVIVTDLRTKNFGAPTTTEGKGATYKLFDYHGITTWRRAKKLQRLSRHFLNFFCLMLYKQDYRDHFHISREDVDKGFIKENGYCRPQFPPPFSDLLETLETRKRKGILVAIEKCIQYLINVDVA